MNTRHQLPLRALTVAIVALVAIASTALALTVLGAAGAAGRLLDLSFTRPDPKADRALAIAATNLRLAAAVLLAAWAVRWRPTLRPYLDSILTLLFVFNSLAVGAALGGYGPTGLKALALHGPLELAGFALAGAAYLSARAGELTTSILATCAGGVAALLLAAAAAETLFPLGGNQ